MDALARCLKRLLVWGLGHIFTWSPSAAAALARIITHCWSRFPRL